MFNLLLYKLYDLKCISQSYFLLKFFLTTFGLNPDKKIFGFAAGYDPKKTVSSCHLFLEVKDGCSEGHI